VREHSKASRNFHGAEGLRRIRAAATGRPKETADKGPARDRVGDLLLRRGGGRDEPTLVRGWADPEVRRWLRYGGWCRCGEENSSRAGLEPRAVAVRAARPFGSARRHRGGWPDSITRRDFGRTARHWPRRELRRGGYSDPAEWRDAAWRPGRSMPSAAGRSFLFFWAHRGRRLACGVSRCGIGPRT